MDQHQEVKAIHYVAVCTHGGGFLVEDGTITKRVDYAGQWDTFIEADNFAKAAGIKKYAILVSYGAVCSNPKWNPFQ